MLRRHSPASVILGAAATLGGAGIAWALDARRRDERTALIHRTMVELLLNTLCAGDPSTARHSRRVADLTAALGETCRLRREDHARLRVAALLHDLGKLDDQLSPIIHSHHRLNASERHHVEEHTYESAFILEPLEKIHPGIGQIVESHHERWDGKGYPRGLSGASIPIESRLISLADVFDALTEPRSYRGPLEIEAAVQEIRKNAGTKFDPAVVERMERPEVWSAWLEIVRKGRGVEDDLATAEHSDTNKSSASARD
jgi:HD-GYP domain-containing protein (c-di-GMP phosphodiesterase class II)